MVEDADLLRQYVNDASQPAFGQLVDRYIDLVYAAARRQVNDAELAEDVTQAVFIILAQKARELCTGRRVAGWLLQVTHYAAADARRKRGRRMHHENKAAEMKRDQVESGATGESRWETVSPLLDEGLSKLREKDRDVLMLRFFQSKNTREVAAELGISESAAEKRMTRAVEKLRDFFRRRGVAVSAVALMSGLAAHPAHAAPVGLNATIAASSGAGTSAATIAKGALVAMAYTKTKTAVIAAVVGALLIGGGTIAYKAIRPVSVRKVAVNTQPAPQFTFNAAPMQPSPWPVTFKDGTKVELLSLTDRPGTAAQWWAPDGSAVPAPVPLPRSILRINPQPGVRLYQFVARQSGADMDKKSIMVFPKQPSNSSASSGDGNSMNLVFALGDNAEKMDMIVQLAAGPWVLNERYDLKGGATTAPSRPSLEIGEMTEKVVRKKPVTTITLRRNSPNLWSGRQEEIKVITKDGREVGAVSSTGSMFGVNEDDFPVAKDQIVALVFRTRPYETLEIQNISLRAGAKTAPIVALSSAR